jgi:orotidine-5'-phosphate decarboxylase
MAESFRSRLLSAVSERGSLCAGIDPTAKVLGAWGLPDSAAGAVEFGTRCVEAFAPHISVVKTNVAFFEQYGAAGLSALESVLAAARDAGLLTLADAKRGDIASTNAAYARAWLSPDSPLAVDAMTVAPYLGARALDPFVDMARQHGRGVFIVVRSSNPEGRAVQLTRGDDGRTLEVALLDEVAGRGEVVGAVIGLMSDEPPLALVGGSFYLAPGLGTQGATWADLGTQFGGMASTPVVANLSRVLVEVGPDPGALRDAALRAKEEIAAQLCPPSS